MASTNVDHPDHGDPRAPSELESEVLGPIARYEQSVLARIRDFDDPRQEWRRLFSEVLGTFMLVLVAAGGGMMSQAFPDTISRQAAVVAPGLMVLAIILFMGKISGAHLNPAVSIAFAVRRDFPWLRLPGYIVAQLVGASLAALVLQPIIDVSARFGSNYPASGYSSGAAFWMELLLTAGFRWAPEILPMNRITPRTIRPGATTAAERLIVPGKAWLIIPPPAATSTSMNVPRSSENNRRHSWVGSLKSSIRARTLRS